MEEIIKHFAQGKIRLRFWIVEPVIPNKKRKRITLIAGILGIALIIGIGIFFIPKFTDTGAVVFLVMLCFVLFLGDLYHKQRLSQFTKKGKILFEVDKIVCYNIANQPILTLEYSEILRIVYKGNLVESASGYHRTYRTYLVKFQTTSDITHTFELTRELVLTQNEMSIQRSIEPTLEHVLTAISPKYGILENKR